VQRADHIAVIADAQVAEYGTHAELIAKGGRYSALASAWKKSQISN
jgi:ABC-type multidrug transport system fused ATPase/permease subunit